MVGARKKVHTFNFRASPLLCQKMCIPLLHTLENYYIFYIKIFVEIQNADNHICYIQSAASGGNQTQAAAIINHD